MRPTEGLLQSRGGAGWAGQSLRRLRGEDWGENMLSSISLFQDYLNNPRTFI